MRKMLFFFFVGRVVGGRPDHPPPPKTNARGRGGGGGGGGVKVWVEWEWISDIYIPFSEKKIFLS